MGTIYRDLCQSSPETDTGCWFRAVFSTQVTDCRGLRHCGGPLPTAVCGYFGSGIIKKKSIVLFGAGVWWELVKWKGLFNIGKVRVGCFLKTIFDLRIVQRLSCELRNNTFRMFLPEKQNVCLANGLSFYCLIFILCTSCDEFRIPEANAILTSNFQENYK